MLSIPPSKDESSGKSSSEGRKRTARLNIFLCNFQLHYYNTWKISEEFASTTKASATTATTTTTSTSFVNIQSLKQSISSSSIMNYFNRNLAAAACKPRFYLLAVELCEFLVSSYI